MASIKRAGAHAVYKYNQWAGPPRPDGGATVRHCIADAKRALYNVIIHGRFSEPRAAQKDVGTSYNYFIYSATLCAYVMCIYYYI